MQECIEILADVTTNGTSNQLVPNRSDMLHCYKTCKKFSETA